MAQPTLISFSYKEIAEILIKNQGLTEGIWGLYLKFGIQATNVAIGPANLAPAAIIPVLEMGLQKFEEENSMSVDAAKVNPPSHRGAPVSKRKAKAS